VTSYHSGKVSRDHARILGFPIPLMITASREEASLCQSKFSVLYLQAARSMSSCTRIAPDITRPRPNPEKMYALFDCHTYETHMNSYVT